MKKETKELIEWIKRHISVTVNDDVELHHKAFDFLNSLPEIESHLCRGGYIQDKNGTPCCDGDEIVLTGDDKTFKESEVTELKGVLQWDRDHFNIVFPTGKKCLVLYLDTFAAFEKVGK